MLRVGHILASFLLFVSVITIVTANAEEKEKSIYLYVEEIPSWADNAGNALYESTEAWKGANPTWEFYLVDNPSSADIQIQWVKEFGTEKVGQAIGRWFIEVGLGDSNCKGKWQPYSANHVGNIMSHEFGHTFGFEHSNNLNDIMYPIVQKKEYGVVEDEVTTTEGYGTFVQFCIFKDATSVYYHVTVDDETYGFDVYVVPSVDSFHDWSNGESFKYYSDKGCLGESFISFGDTCKGVSTGAGLLILMDSELTNPLTKLTIKTQEDSFQKITSMARISYHNPIYAESPEQYEEPIYRGTVIVPDTFPTMVPRVISPQPNIDLEYRDLAFVSKTTYSSLIQQLKSGIETAENSLSGLVYESPAAQKKIEQAWTQRYNALQHLENAEFNFDTGNYELKKDRYQNAVTLYKKIDSSSESVGKSLRWITAAIDDAKKMENEYQSQKQPVEPPKKEEAKIQNEEKEKFCFLFWCW